MREVTLGHRDIRALEPFVGAGQLGRALDTAESFRAWLGSRSIWNISSTAVGGGVAEMLVPLLSYSHSLGIRVNWLVMNGSPAFFRVTKRLHHALHGSPGDGSPLSQQARRIYRRVARQAAAELDGRVGPRDIALLHDPQTAGLAPYLARRGLLVIWRCHIGSDQRSDEADRGWRFLVPELSAARAYVFSRAGYVPPTLDRERTHIIMPSIDALSPKNQPLGPRAVVAILERIGVVAGADDPGDAVFVRTDGSTGQVTRQAEVFCDGEPPAPDTPLVVQISRWDPLKDMVGVMHGFARLVEQGRAGEAHLLLVGPDVRGVTDDPEGPAVLEDARAAWTRLAPPVRARISLCTLPIDDIEENAAMVNAIQRHARVVCQKSLREGFGLTVTEAMWKARPVLASAVGGIQDQIEHQVHGLLLQDPHDLVGFADLLHALLADPDQARRYGEAARERVRVRFLGVRHLLEYAELMTRLE